MKKSLFIMLLAFLAAPLAASVSEPQDSEKVVTFRFVPGEDMFYIPWQGNDGELNRLYALVDEYRAEITSGKIPVHVDEYCASQPGATENFKMAVIRSNRVKSELITHKGLLEEHFVTKNHTATYTATPLGWLFTGKLTGTIEADKNYTFTVPMKQQVRQLTLTIEPTGGTPADIPLESDLSSGLADFNTEKNEPLALNGGRVELQTEAGFTATIYDWTKNTGTGIAD